MTDIQVLRKVIEELDNINVPIKYFDQIGAQIKNASNDLKTLHNFIVDQYQKRQEEAKKADGEQPVEETSENVIVLPVDSETSTESNKEEHEDEIV